jgi:hypothetical protein
MLTGIPPTRRSPVDYQQRYRGAVTRERWIGIGAAAAIIVALVAGFGVGRTTAGDTVQNASTAVTTTTIQQYGDPPSRETYLVAVRGSLPPGNTEADEELLTAGDSVCVNLEGFTRQGRDALYAVRILWTDQLRYLNSTEAAVFGLVLSAAPQYLCPQYSELASDVSYWLGF